MKNDVAPNDLRTLWQGQRREFAEMSVDEIRKKVQKYRRKVRRRNAIEYVALISVVAFMVFVIWKFPAPLMRTWAALSIAAVLYIGHQLYKRGAAKMEPADRALTTWLDFHRRELERQRDLMRNSWRWYLGPMVPSLVVWAVAIGISNPGHLAHVWRVVAACSVIVAAAFVWVRRTHVRCALNLQRQIDELDAMEMQR
jgi:membrane protein YdbS with pleckstrin-like domain